jgi:hypothetical protein
MKEAYMAIAAPARRCVLGVMDESGRSLDAWQFPTTESELIRHVVAVKSPHKRLAIEEGPLAYWIAQTLPAYVADVFLCEPRENPLNSRSAHQSDAVDTPKLCRRQRLGALKRVYPPADEHRAVNKAAVQAYVALVREQARHKQNNRANNRAWGVAEQDTTKD